MNAEPWEGMLPEQAAPFQALYRSIKEQSAEYDDLRAERDRYREALEQIVATDLTTDDTTVAIDIASSALEGFGK